MNDSNGVMRRKVLLASMIGNFVEWFDYALYGLFATTIATVFFPKSDPKAALLATFAIFGASFVVRPLGGIVFGHLGDKFGRRFTLLLSVMLMSAATVAVGLLPGYAQIGIAAPMLLLACRLVQGFSVGGEYTGSLVFVAEHAPLGKRGRYASIPSAASYVAGIFGVSVALSVTATTTPEQLASWAWRVPFLLAAPLALVGVYLRVRVEESPEFAAMQAAGDIESAPVKKALKVAKKPMLILIGWVMAVSVASWLLSAFILSYLTTTVGFSKTESLVVQFVWYVSVVFGCLLSGFAIDRVGRKPVAVASALALGASAIPTFAILRHSSVLGAALVIAVLAIFFSGAWTTTGLIVAELFPAHLRSSASAMSYNFCAGLFGGTAPFVATWLVEQGYPLGPGYYLAALCAIAVIVAAIGIGNHAPTNSPRNDLTPIPSESSPLANV
ncbi:MFS transporter [Nocardia sp. NPDC059246]|uniref:MFS transporter n=1 Tax=unclassified Nocardia TaxID=2637762 RepID=UPI0036A7C963